jgi:hypothetical protein
MRGSLEFGARPRQPVHPWGGASLSYIRAGRGRKPPAACRATASSGGSMSNEFDLGGPSAGGRPARRMNSASRGLRPAVGLRRPGRRSCVGGGRRLARSAGEGRFQSAGEAFGRRSACAPNEFGLQGPSANGRPAPTGRGASFCVGGRPTPGAERLRGPISIGGGPSAKVACAPNEFGLQGPSAGGRPVPTGRRSLLRRRRPTPGAERLRGRFQSAEAFDTRFAPWV